MSTVILSPRTLQMCRLTDAVMVAVKQGDRQETYRLLEAQKRLLERLKSERTGQ